MLNPFSASAPLPSTAFATLSSPYYSDIHLSANNERCRHRRPQPGSVSAGPATATGDEHFLLDDNDDLDDYDDHDDLDAPPADARSRSRSLAPDFFLSPLPCPHNDFSQHPDDIHNRRPRSV